MTIAKEQHANNIVLGAGEVYFDEEDAAGNLTGERYLGDSVAATLGVTTERTTVQSGDGAVAEDLVDITRSISRTLGFTLHDMSPENWDLFILGAGVSDSAAVAANAVADQAVTLRKGRWLQIGATAANPAGVGAVSSANFSIKSGPTGNNVVLEAKYDLDAKAGRLYLKPTADFAGAARITYTPVAAAAGDRKIAKTGSIRQRRGAVRYIETGAAGKGRNVYARRVNLAPAGEVALKSRDTEQQLAFTGTVVAAPTGSQDLVIDGEPA